MVADWEFDKEAGSFQPVPPNQYLYPTTDLCKGKPKSFFGRNLLSPDSNGILLLFPCHPSCWTNTGFGPPSPGRGTSTCKGIDHLVSGLAAVTWALLIPCPSSLAGLRALAFASASHRKWLTSPQLQTPSLVFQDEQQDTESSLSIRRFPGFTSRDFTSSVPCQPMTI